MDPAVPCISCGVPNPWHERFCRACGSPLGGGASIPGASASMVKAGMSVRRRTLKLGWVIGGAFVMMAIGTLVGAAILALAAPSVLREGNVEGEDPEAVAGLLVALGAGLLASFFVGGVLVGRLSKGRTIVEPGLAACLASSGLLLVTGPTGSGKTTTLYACLHYINRPDRKIITVEDPVEYQLEGVNQIQVKPQIGLDFAGALRSIVRQDPDVIMIGEMRDLETAKIAIQSALTGHLVLSTLHPNNAAGAVTRLLDMGVDDYLMCSTVNGVLAQRLVRRLDRESSQRYIALPEVVADHKLRQYTRHDPIYLHKPVPSERSATGYLGRTTIMEFLVMTDPIRRLVMQHADHGKIEALAREEGMRTMYEDGMAKALAGATTIEEVLRVCQET